MQDNVREELIKQFQAEVLEIMQESGNSYYACPTCKRAITRSDSKCPGCSQALNWESIRPQDETQQEVRHARMTFEVTGDFSPGECRKCPLSYLTKANNENVYECVLKMHGGCRLEII